MALNDGASRCFSRMEPAQSMASGTKIVKLRPISNDERPWAAAASSSSSDAGPNLKKTAVKRLDGTVEEVITGAPPNNPAFVPRLAHPGGKIITNDKLEVKLRFYERKGMALTPELIAKKAELDALSQEAKQGPNGGANKAGKGKQKVGGGGKGSSAASSLSVPIVPPKAPPEVQAWIKNRPKGGVKVLSGTEGSLGKRPAEGDAPEAPAAKK